MYRRYARYNFPVNEIIPASGDQRCGNCESVLTGPYCASCGQHAHASARTLSAVVHDGWHDLTHLDGRLWRSLWFLMARPGQLTLDYFEERRARYLPPVRLYLVLSVVFFSLSLATNEHPKRVHARATPAPAAAEQDTDDARDDADPPRLSCDSIKVDGGAALQEAARAACERGKRKNGASYWQSVAHDIPKMMFVFLPLMAAALIPLYRKPKRYYVEHLVYLLHNHSALFLCFSLFALLERSGRLWHPLVWLSVAAGAATFLYAMWYPYASMRRYYRQGRAWTFLKYTVVLCAYLACLAFTLSGVAALAALEM